MQTLQLVLVPFIIVSIIIIANLIILEVAFDLAKDLSLNRGCMVVETVY